MTVDQNATSRPVHHFTVDVEEYFQVSALEPYVAYEEWDRHESRFRPCMDRILAMMDAAGARGTFFVLGWIADRYPGVLRDIAAGGHEIASHGWEHRRVTMLTPDEFRESVRRSKARLEDLTGRAVLGYRAPSFSIVPGRDWALDLLLEEGYRYDSSLFPIRRRGYGFPGAQRDPHTLARAAGSLAEVPPTTLRVGGVNLPAAGGGYFRLLPYAIFDTALRQAEARGVPGTFYIHPWELDPDQPRFDVPWTTRVRHYGGLHRTESRLERLFGSFHFGTIASTLNLAAEACPIPA